MEKVEKTLFVPKELIAIMDGEESSSIIVNMLIRSISPGPNYTMSEFMKNSSAYHEVNGNKYELITFVFRKK